MRRSACLALGLLLAVPVEHAAAAEPAPSKPQAEIKLRGSHAAALQAVDPLTTASIRPALPMADPPWRRQDALALRGGMGDAFFYDPHDRWRLRQLVQPVGVDWGSEALGLRGAVGSALSTSDALRASLHDVKAAEGEVWRALARFTPTISASLTLGRESNSFDGLGGETGSLDTRYSSISMSMPVFTSGERFFGLKAARSNALSAGYQATAQRDGVVLRTVGAYLQHVYAGAASELYKRDEGRLERLMSALRAQRRAGFASGADVAEIDAELAARQQLLVDALATRAKTRIEVESLAGRPVAFRTSFPKLDHALGRGHSALLARVQRRNAGVMAAAHASDAANFSSKSAVGRYLPQVNLTGEYRRDYETIVASRDPDRWSVGVRLTMPLVDLTTAADIKIARERSIAARYRATDTRREMQSEFTMLWEDYLATQSTLRLAKAKVAAQTKVANASLARYDRGLASLRDVLDDQRSLTAAQLDELQTRVRLTYTICQLLVMADVFDIALLDG